ncbi:hypothetical protein [Acetivibrio cellulolyticus]|uniref:hypothetical protein n=1 Tax=Acetivibrio cellulolyticus TaxID=35830 RepID=UPI0001E2C292|nr:hypothetical protein [Acetivibrio cellulolyticus]
MEVRELQFSDLFQFAKITKKVNIKGILKQFVGSVDTKNMAEEEVDKISREKGLEIIISLFSEAGDAELEIMKFIGNLCSTNIETIQKWKFNDLKEFYTKLIEANKNEDLIDFFKQAMN